MKITVDRLDKFLTEVHFQTATIAADNNMIKVNNTNTRTRCEVCSKLTIKTSERRVLLSLLLTLRRSIPAGMSNVISTSGCTAITPLNHMILSEKEFLNSREEIDTEPVVQ